MLNNKEGMKVPVVTFPTRVGHEWKKITSEDLFTGKTVVVFSLPGAFTPTCSSSHVPRYNQLASKFKSLGVDEIVCVSVNDSFVMNEWQEEQEAWNLTFLADGNAEFTDGMGMLVNKSEIGFGKRSWRYSMLVRDGVVEKMFIEKEEPGDPFSVSDADTMLHYLDADAKVPMSATIFTRKGCPFCVLAKQLLDDANIEYEELMLNQHYKERTLRAVSGRQTYPQVFIDGQHIGGSDDLQTWLNQLNSKAA